LRARLWCAAELASERAHPGRECLLRSVVQRLAEREATRAGPVDPTHSEPLFALVLVDLDIDLDLLAIDARQVEKILAAPAASAEGLQRDLCGLVATKAADPLAFLLALNLDLAAKETAGEKITPPGLPLPEAERPAFVTEDCVWVA
jgi:hypothetical protein